MGLSRSPGRPHPVSYIVIDPLLGTHIQNQEPALTFPRLFFTLETLASRQAKHQRKVRVGVCARVTDASNT